MKHTPILFSTAMVQALLAGRKTQTRRTIKDQPFGEIIEQCNSWPKLGNWISKNVIPGDPIRYQVMDIFKCPYGQPGDVLWVRETIGIGQASGAYYYKFHNDGSEHQCVDNYKNYFNRWKPSIHMPKDAARIFLKIVSIKVERAQDISESDAKKRGVC